jgi:hypothetical protein
MPSLVHDPAKAWKWIFSYFESAAEIVRNMICHPLAFSVPIGTLAFSSGPSFQILITWLHCFGSVVEALEHVRPNLAVIKPERGSTVCNRQGESSAENVLSLLGGLGDGRGNEDPPPNEHYRSDRQLIDMKTSPVLNNIFDFNVLPGWYH